MATIDNPLLTQFAANAANDNPPKRFIHGELTQQSQETVQALHARFKQKIEDTIKQAIPADSSEDLRKACFDYCVALSRTRQKANVKQLTQKAAAGVDALNAETQLLLQEQHELDKAMVRYYANGTIEKVTRKYGYETAYYINQYCEALLRAGKTVTIAELDEKAKIGRDALAKEASAIKKAIPEGLNVTLEHAKAFKEILENGLKEQAVAGKGELSKAFEVANAGPNGPFPEAQGRMYFKLSDYSSSPVRPFVEKYLAEKGFTITDYAQGYAVDQRKNQWKIGKILKDAPSLLETYQEDPYRIGKNLMVVITRSYDDLARGSYGRGWKSCRANAQSAASYSIKEIDVGVMAAYLVSADDPDIHNPLGRVNIKPYRQKEKVKDGEDKDKDRVTKTAYFTFNPIGIHHPGFVDAVNQIVDEKLNAGLAGKFNLSEGCESYMEFAERTLLPDDAEEALKQLNVKYTKDDNGKITVEGNLNLRSKGLYKLPNLKDVIVMGEIDVSHNKLLTLEGLPLAPAKKLNVSRNLLSCFTGAPAEVVGTFNYQDNPYLLTTLDAPKAAEYRYGNAGYHKTGQKNKYGEDERADNHGKGTEPVSPHEQPVRFPGFKRNR